MYAVASSSENLHYGDIGLNEEVTFAISHRDVSAVVSKCSEGGIVLEDARVHEKVLLRMMETGAVIPMAFGFTLENGEMVKNLLVQGYTSFREALDRLSDKMQLNLKVSWDKYVLKSLILDKHVNDYIRKVKENPKDLNAKVELGKRVKLALSNMEKELRPIIFDHLNSSTTGLTENKIQNEDMIINASILLAKGALEEFLIKLDELEDRFKGRLVFQSIYPLPPYDFVGIKIKKADYDQLEKARTLLNLDENVTISEIKDAYTKLARIHHPDHSLDPNGNSRFTQIKRSYDTLMEFLENKPHSLQRQDVDNTLIFSRSLHQESDRGTLL